MVITKEPIESKEPFRKKVCPEGQNENYKKNVQTE
jgi:hypothetical protein